MGKKKEFKAWKKRQKENEAIEAECILPVDGFYNFYSVPWDLTKYVKFPTEAILLPLKNGSASGNPGFAIDSMGAYTKQRKTFVKHNYLGSARLTDTHRLRALLKGMTEIDND